jgi:hypothetical protein
MRREISSYSLFKLPFAGAPLPDTACRQHIWTVQYTCADSMWADFSFPWFSKLGINYVRMYLQ